MATKVYGCSDDNVEFEGDVYGEVSHYGGNGNDDKGALLIFSDGTLLVAKYGGDGKGLWKLTLKSKGKLFDRIDVCVEEDEQGYSDVAHFKDGLKWAYAGTEWQKVK